VRRPLLHVGVGVGASVGRHGQDSRVTKM
jgi:hypothetical protein